MAPALERAPSVHPQPTGASCGRIHRPTADPGDPDPLRRRHHLLRAGLPRAGRPHRSVPTPTIRPEQLEGLIRQYGLDRPLPEQFWSWLTSYVQIWNEDAWGYSFLDGQRPHEDRGAAAGDALLGGTALVVTVVVSIPLGILAAVRQYSWSDRIISTMATIGYAIPSFLLGLYLLYFGGVVLGWFPLFGLESFGSQGDPFDIAWHLVLPVTVQQIAGWSRYVRASMLEVLHQDFVRTARAKGLPGRRVTFRHALRNASFRSSPSSASPSRRSSPARRSPRRSSATRASGRWASRRSRTATTWSCWRS